MTQPIETLTERIVAQVQAARRAIDRRANATRPRLRRARPAIPSDPAIPSVEETPETRSLQRVFQNLGLSYRRHRRETGGPVTPGLRDAAYRFRAEPSLASLVAVATILDQLDLVD